MITNSSDHVDMEHIINAYGQRFYIN